MTRLFINPRYRERLQRHGLHAADDFLRLSGIIICGHPDRNVSQIRLDDSDGGLSLYLKKEHRVRLRDRFANLCAGFGFVSKTYKEKALKSVLLRRRIAAPEVIAAGEQGGQAFLLARDVESGTDLRRFLGENHNPRMRLQLARKLGADLARIHQAGLAHRDLYAKHVMVEIGENGFCFHFLDWQRARRARSVSWGQRCRDLATLQATLADELATPRERRACLVAYCRASSADVILPQDFSYFASMVRAEAEKLSRKRHIREMRQPPLPVAQQNLIWLDGEALCVTKEFRAEVQGEVPDWVPRLRSKEFAVAGAVEQTVTLPGAGVARMISRQVRRPWRWLWSCLAGRPMSSPELDEAAAIFRLQRFGVALPRLLAVGQHRSRRWHARSFLLTEVPTGLVLLADWLRAATTGARQRQHVMAAAADQLRRLHQAGYYFRTACDANNLFGVSTASPSSPSVCLRSVTDLCRRRRASAHRIGADLREFLKQCTVSRTDALRFLLSYCQASRVTPEFRAWLGQGASARPRSNRAQEREEAWSA